MVEPLTVQRLSVHNAAMKSMTGFGSAEVEIAGSRLNIVTRSLNGRFLEIRLHAPREFLPLESRIKKLIGKKVNRGNVDVFITRKGLPHARLKVNAGRVREWMAAYKKLAREAGMEMSPALLVRLADNPQIVEVEERNDLNGSNVRMVDRCLEKALQQLDSERRREGMALKRELLRILQRLQKTLMRMQSARENAKQEIERKMRQRLAEIQSLTPVETGRFSEELVYHLDRSDIREEIIRFQEHLQQCTELVRSGRSEGRKLDFYSQELLREVNTIGSKSGVAELTQLVVDAKGLIENFKEQVQNVE